MNSAIQYRSSWEEIAPQVKRFVHRWQASNQPTSVVCIVHGLGEHGGRYAPLASYLASTGLEVFAFDQQGHGMSPGRRGEIASYDSMLEDIHAMLLWVQQQTSGLPQILFGHSMGGNLVLNYALRKQAAAVGVISSSPMIRANKAPAAWMEYLLRGALHLVPNHQLKAFIIPERLMSDPSEQRALVEDQLFHNRLTLRLGAALLDSGRWLLAHAPRLAIPTLLVHGTSDYLTSHEASREFALAAGEACRLELLEGQLHDTFRDLERQRVLDLISEFVQQQTTSSGEVGSRMGSGST